MRILVVEDEAGIREGLREQLAEAGFTVDVAADGEEGLFAGTRISHSMSPSSTSACRRCPAWN